MKSRQVSAISSCERTPSESYATSRDVDIVYTDMFLDTFNYEHDLQELRQRLVNMGSSRDQKALLVLSQPIYDTVYNNENNDVLFDGRCIITEPSSFGHHNTELVSYDILVFFNVDPFVHAESPASGTGTTGSSVSTTLVNALVSTPFGTTFDHYMMNPGAVTRTTVITAYNTFLVRTESVLSYETSRRIRVNFNARVLLSHNFDRETTLRTACNFCTDTVLCMPSSLYTYTVRPDKSIPSHRALGVTITQTMSRPESLVLLEVGAYSGKSSAATDYYRFRQFYYSFAHGRKNKWGIRLTGDRPLQTYLHSLNMMLKEELRRWYWILGRVVEKHEHANFRCELMQRQILDVYNMYPCVLNATGIDNNIYGGDIIRSDIVACEEPRATASGCNTRDRLMVRFDTSTFNIGPDPTDPEFIKSLLVNNVSINDTMIVANARPITSVHLEYNRYFQTMLSPM